MFLRGSIEARKRRGSSDHPRPGSHSVRTRPHSPPQPVWLRRATSYHPLEEATLLRTRLLLADKAEVRDLYI